MIIKLINAHEIILIIIYYNNIKIKYIEIVLGEF